METTKCNIVIFHLDHNFEAKVLEAFIPIHAAFVTPFYRISIEGTPAGSSIESTLAQYTAHVAMNLWEA